MIDYVCQSCDEEFESSARFGDNATCTHCGAVNETDWDYIDAYEGNIAYWTTGLVAMNGAA